MTFKGYNYVGTHHWCLHPHVSEARPNANKQFGRYTFAKKIRGRGLLRRRLYGSSEYRVQFTYSRGERGGSVVERRTPEREVCGSKPTSAVLCP